MNIYFFVDPEDGTRIMETVFFNSLDAAAKVLRTYDFRGYYLEEFEFVNGVCQLTNNYYHMPDGKNLKLTVNPPFTVYNETTLDY